MRLVAIALVAISCTRSAPPTTGAPPPVSKPAAPAAPAFPEAARAELVSKYGAVFGTPIFVTVGPPRWIVLVADGGAPLSGWLVEPDGSIRPAMGRWPWGAMPSGRVAVVDRDWRVDVDIDVLSTAALDQPAGLSGRVEVRLRKQLGSLLPGTTSSDFEIEAVVPAIDWVDAAEHEPDVVPALHEAATSDDALARLWPAGGVPVLKLYHQTFARTVSTLATPAEAGELRKLLAAISSCEGRRCARDGSAAGELVTYTLLGDKPVLRAWVRGESARTPSSAAALVAPAPDPGALARTAAAFGVHDKLLAQAPLRGGQGLIGVIGQSAQVVARDGDFADLTVSIDAPVTDARFVDYDGDGLTDVVVEGHQDPSRSGVSFLITGGPTADSLAGRAAELAAMGGRKKDLDGAVHLALAAPAKPIDPAAACRLVAKAAHDATGVELFTYVVPNGHPGMSWDRAQGRAKELETELEGRKGTCAATIRCSPTRPYCQFSNDGGPGETMLLFGGPAATPKLLRAVMYAGT